MNLKTKLLLQKRAPQLPRQKQRNELEKILQHWKSLGLKFDGILIGYLGSHRQIEIVSRIIDEMDNGSTHEFIDVYFFFHNG